MNLLTSQVCAGVILSLLSRLSGFQDVVMNKKSFEYLKLIALVGKNVYMFLIGLQLDLHQMWPSIYRAKFISMGGLLMPFAFGVPMAYLLSEYDDHEGHNVFVFYFFIGTCMAVTALPVLSHILAQEDLTETRVGETAISAAVTDDIISWIILAVLQTLASPSEASRRVQNVIYELLCLLAFGLFLHYLVKPLFVYLESHMNLDEYRVVIYMSLFVGAFFTQSIGINSFLGSFMVGLSMPHQSHFSHEVAESLEDLVQYFLIPIYFAYVGFYTRFDTFGPKEWGFTFLLVFMTFVSKTFGCAISSMRQNFSWRESLSIGIIMNSKGLIELVVLQLGLDLQIVDATVYSMFIFTMTVLTACTVPLTHLVYPFHEQRYDSQSKLNSPMGSTRTLAERNVLLVVNDFEAIPASMSLISLISFQEDEHMHFLRLIDLGDRPVRLLTKKSAMRSLDNDVGYSLINQFCESKKITLDGHLEVAPPRQYCMRIREEAEKKKSRLLLVPLVQDTFNVPGQYWNLTTIDHLFKEAKVQTLVFLSKNQDNIKRLHFVYQPTLWHSQCLDILRSLDTELIMYCDTLPVEFPANIQIKKQQLDIEKLSNDDLVLCDYQYFASNEKQECSFLVFGA